MIKQSALITNTPEPRGDFFLARVVTESQALAAPKVPAGPAHARRKPVSFEALTELRLLESVPWHIREIGYDSLLVETDPMGLKVGDTIEIQLRCRINRQPVEHRLQARVAKVSRREVEFNLEPLGDAARADMRRLLDLL